MADEIKDLPVVEQADGTVLVPSLEAPEVLVEGETAEGETTLVANQGEEEDEQGHAEETPEEAEARRQRNRARKQLNKQRRQEHVESLRREIAARDTLLAEMGQRLAVVERKASGSDMARLDAAANEAQNAYNYFKTQVAQAVESANGALHAEALEKMQMAQQRLAQLGSIKKAMLRPTQQAPALDPRLINHAQEWMKENRWYNPVGADPDSAVVMALDDSLAREGWNPTTHEYWQELDARVRRYLPHRVNKGYNTPQEYTSSAAPPRVPVAGGGSPSNTRPAGAGYALSAERVSAMKQAGIWDDPAKRADMIRRYQEEDRRAAANR